MKSGRLGNAESANPDSSSPTERLVFISQIAPAFFKSRINSMHCASRTGSLTRDTRVPSKSMLSSLIAECIYNNLRVDFADAIHHGSEANWQRDRILRGINSPLPFVKGRG